MTSEKLDEKAIFNVARRIESPEARAEYLRQVCGPDVDLMERVETLLSAYEEQASFLESPASDLTPTTDQSPIAEQPGTVIGPYKLLQQIGEGGMGVVFMAEQTEPIQRTVALKIIKPGMDTRQVIARFEAERQALAMMDHPNIAKVLDAGTTDSGRPYFVMELVKGVPITKYCDEKQLTLRERLELLKPVCEAVQHAHQKGIIHRDIKPTNVLVAEYDNHAVPKVIDFGVAKATAKKLTERTMFTEFGQVIGTVEYMSPEQAKFNQLDIDTRSDIYSLGVLLYELLTGSTPFEQKRLREAAFDEVLRIIREEDPPKPSTRLSTSETLPSIAANRHTEPARLSRDVSGELDWIVMRCLEKDRNRRYETPNSLARDIERYLHDEPVQACPPSAAYRLKKFVRRNKIAAAFILLLVAAMTALAVSNIQTRRNERRALTESANANAVSDLLLAMLASSSPDTLKGRFKTVRQLLDDFSAGLENRLTGQPEIEAAIRTAIGKSYWRLGENETAEPHLKKALELRREMLGANDARVADSLIDYAWNLGDLSRFAEAKACVEDAVSIYEQQNSDPHVTENTANALYSMAVLQLRLGDKAGYRKTCKMVVQLPVRSFYASRIARPIWTTCLAPDALDDMSLPIKRAEEFLANNSLDPLHFRRFMLGASLYRAGQYEKAAQYLTESVTDYPTSPGLGYDTFNYQRLFLAMTLCQLGQRDEARRLLDETKVAIEEELASPLTEWNRRATFELLGGEAEALIGQKEPGEAIENESRPSNELKQ